MPINISSQIIADDVLASSNICTAMNIIVTDMAGAIGGSPEAYVFLYVMFVIIPLLLVLSITRNVLIGLLGLTGGHIIVLLLGSAGCIPLPVEYWIMGNVIYLVIAGLFFYLYKASSGSGYIRY